MLFFKTYLQANDPNNVQANFCDITDASSVFIFLYFSRRVLTCSIFPIYPIRENY